MDEADDSELLTAADLKIKRTLVSNLPQLILLQELQIHADWPDAAEWIRDPAALLRDLGKFEKLVEMQAGYELHPEHGPCLPDPRKRRGSLVWDAFASRFVQRLRAAQSMRESPVDADRIGRVVQLVNNVNGIVERVDKDENGRTMILATPMLAERERSAMLGEALQIMLDESNTLWEFIRLNEAQQKRSGDDPAPDEYEYSEPLPKSFLAEHVQGGISVDKLRTLIQSGAIRIFPGTSDRAQKIRVHIDDLPSKLKRKHERVQLLEEFNKRKEPTKNRR